jgi:hypothetical protein
MSMGYKWPHLRAYAMFSPFTCIVFIRHLRFSLHILIQRKQLRRWNLVLMQQQLSQEPPLITAINHIFAVRHHKSHSLNAFEIRKLANGPESDVGQCNMSSNDPAHKINCVKRSESTDSSS